MSKELTTYTSTWREKNPDWQYIRWSEQTIFPLYNQEMFMWTLDDPVRTNELRSSLARFEILHRYGGVWFDPQMECLNSFDFDLSLRGFVVPESASVIGSEANADFLWETVVRIRQDKHALNNSSLAAWHLYHAVLSHDEVVKMPVCKFFPHDAKGHARCDVSQALTTYHW